MPLTLHAPTAPQTRESLHDSLVADGYEIGKPKHINAGAIDCDRETATEARCEDCGHVGLLLIPYRRHSSYRAMAFCPECDGCFEM